MDMNVLNINLSANKISFLCVIYGDTCADLVPDANGLYNPNKTALSSCNAVNIYFDQGTLGMKFDGTSSQSNSALDSSAPNFLWNASASLDPRASRPLFQVDFVLFLAFPGSDIFYYPLDEYLADAYLFGIDNVTGDPVSVRPSVFGIAFGFTTELLKPSEVPINVYRGPFYARIDDATPSSKGYTPLHFLIRRASMVQVYVFTIVVAMFFSRGDFVARCMDLYGALPSSICLVTIVIITLWQITRRMPKEQPHVIAPVRTDADAVEDVGGGVNMPLLPVEAGSSSR
ncbi:hypothetical protein K488DRAFT_83863 [Vararia minispora EC-137]|uniref:Uncharacterized protein n=1 Tax=Vararia minispora EC-137 TaxID=1314806 RepID=A0ACB8QST7_9AGAM|nr:hypothetical protein K488DRAFT_83863 [Vararia minispora EC-137]